MQVAYPYVDVVVDLKGLLPIATREPGVIAILGMAANGAPAPQEAPFAIEDAAVLAKALSEAAVETAAEVPAALRQYARLRRQRAARVQRAARDAGRIYHLTGPIALARDLAIRAMGPQRLLARQNWIYDWRL